MPERDLFANFARMRREMDQLFGDWPGRGLTAARATGFSPHVDVYYCGDPQRAIVKVDLAGIELSEVNIELSGRDGVYARLCRSQMLSGADAVSAA